MEGLLERNINTALKAIAEAIKLDSSNKHVEAYWQYLQSITFIIKCLVQDFSNKGVQKFQITAMTKKFVKLGLQSVERLGTVVENIGDAPVSFRYERPSHERLPTPTDPRKASSQPPDSPLSSMTSLRMDLSPMEEAQLRNQQLVSNYKARMARIASPSDKRATELSLTLQRKLIENASIAKSRQEAVERKMLERRRNMEQEAAKRLSSKEDQEFFATVMKYEEKAKWPIAWRERVAQNPKDERLIILLVEQVLRANDHPITKALLKFQLDIYHKIKPLVDKHVEKVNAVTVPFEDDSPTEEGNADEENVDENIGSDVDIAPSSSEDNLKELEASLEDDEAVTVRNFVDVTEEVKTDLKESIAKGDSVVHQSIQGDQSDEIKRISFAGSAMTSSTASEEFDDLFDDDDDDSDSVAKSNATDDAVSHSDVECNVDGAAEQKKPDRKKLSTVSMNLDEDLTPLQQAVTKDVHSCLNKLLWLFIITYEQLDTTAGRDHLYVSLEDPFFKRIWPHLLLFFRVVNLQREVELAKVMTRMSSSSPGDLSIREKFCLMGGARAYFPAVEEVLKIKHFFSPLKKLQCLVNMSRSICQCVEDFYGSMETGKPQGSSALGADDLLPIISFVIIHSQMPQLYSECAALEEFIHHGYLYGEEGYCLTSVLTALAYIVSLSKKPKSPPGSSQAVSPD